MVRLNTHYGELKDSYLFYGIAQKTKAYLAAHPEQRLLRLGIGDVSRPLCPAVIRALHAAADDQANAETFRGYMPEAGADFLREAVRGFYAGHGVRLTTDEIFISSGASDTLGDLLDLFSEDNTVLIPEPAYPAYVDANVIAGHRIVHLPSGEADGFAPVPAADTKADIVYICSPGNPTGAVYTREKLQAWIDWANREGAVILFDAAYEAFIQDPEIPHSIFELDGAAGCAIEICSLSKTAGFTGTRCGYTVIPAALERGGMSLNAMWLRNRTTKTNGVSYIIQRAAEAVFTEEGQRQIRESIEFYRRNAACLMQALDACGIRYCGGRNGPYIWLACPGGMDSWTFFDCLLEEAQIVGTPGAGFGACGDAWFRFTSFGSETDTREAAGRLVGLFGKNG